MKTTYRREMKHNYLIINPDVPEYKGFETQMLEKNSIEGLLEFHIKSLDGQRSCYYEITSKQSLSRILEYKSLGEEELRTLIGGIARTLSRLEAYLLKEDQILLDPEYIYVDPERFKVFLCLIPGRKGTFSQEMTELLRYLLGKVNHQDKECVVMAYGLYQESLKDNYGIDDLLEITENKSNDLKYGASMDKTHISDEEEYHGVISSQLAVQDEEAYETIIPENQSDINSGYSLAKVILLIAVAIAVPVLILWLVSGIQGVFQFWYVPFGAGCLSLAVLLFFGGKNDPVKEREQEWESGEIEIKKKQDINNEGAKPDIIKWDNKNHYSDKTNGIKKDSLKRDNSKKDNIKQVNIKQVNSIKDNNKKESNKKGSNKKDGNKKDGNNKDNNNKDNYKKNNSHRDYYKKDNKKSDSYIKDKMDYAQGEEYDWQMAFIEEDREPANQPEEKDEEIILQTVLLTDTTVDNNTRYLRAVGSEIPDITISYVPYLIGKQEGLVDYVLESETISRIHAKIDREGEEYQLCDLNSTNGTSVNGRMLETNETVTLNKGDEIFIANFAFIFT